MQYDFQTDPKSFSPFPLDPKCLSIQYSEQGLDILIPLFKRWLYQASQLNSEFILVNAENKWNYLSKDRMQKEITKLLICIHWIHISSTLHFKVVYSSSIDRDKLDTFLKAEKLIGFHIINCFAFSFKKNNNSTNWFIFLIFSFWFFKNPV
jgi:hypothetical protein